MLKRSLIAILVLLALLLGSAWAGASYVAPQKELDLSYTDISAFSKVSEMVKKRQTSVELSEAEVNQLLKRALSEHTQLSDIAVLKGAEFTQRGGQLDGDLSVVLYDRLPVGLHVQYRLETKGSVLSAQFVNATVRGREVPRSWLNAPDFEFDVNSQVPALGPIGITRLELLDSGIRVQVGLKLGS